MCMCACVCVRTQRGQKREGERKSVIRSSAILWIMYFQYILWRFLIFYPNRSHHLIQHTHTMTFSADSMCVIWFTIPIAYDWILLVLLFVSLSFFAFLALCPSSTARCFLLKCHQTKSKMCSAHTHGCAKIKTNIQTHRTLILFISFFLSWNWFCLFQLGLSFICSQPKARISIM